MSRENQEARFVIHHLDSEIHIIPVGTLISVDMSKAFHDPRKDIFPWLASKLTVIFALTGHIHWIVVTSDTAILIDKFGQRYVDLSSKMPCVHSTIKNLSCKKNFPSFEACQGIILLPNETFDQVGVSSTLISELFALKMLIETTLDPSTQKSDPHDSPEQVKQALGFGFASLGQLQAMMPLEFTPAAGSLGNSCAGKILTRIISSQLSVYLAIEFHHRKLGGEEASEEFFKTYSIYFSESNPDKLLEKMKFSIREYIRYFLARPFPLLTMDFIRFHPRALTKQGGDYKNIPAANGGEQPPRDTLYSTADEIEALVQKSLIAQTAKQIAESPEIRKQLTALEAFFPTRLQRTVDTLAAPVRLGLTLFQPKQDHSYSSLAKLLLALGIAVIMYLMLTELAPNLGEAPSLSLSR